MQATIEVAPEPKTAGTSAPGLRWTWLALGLLFAAGFGCWLFRDSLTLGFLLDDFFHVDYLVKAFNGQPELLTRLLYSNWSSDTTLTSYRPAVSFSLAADYALWHINAFGYHLTNLLLFAGCIVFVGLTALELSSAFNVHRTRSVAVGAALLFAAYPLHPEAVAWIIGRVDILCSLLTLVSFYAYLLYRRSQAKWQLVVSLAAFTLALASKEMAVTLPIAATLFEWLAPTPGAGKQLKFKFNTALVALWINLAAFATWRTLILGTIVGGYGASGWETVKQGWRNFRDVPTLSKLFFGASEEFVVTPGLKLAAEASFITISTCALVSLVRQKGLARLYLFLCMWTIVSVAPTFQIWHIWPNLVGSRLFFLGSAPLCILIAALALAVPPIIFAKSKIPTFIVIKLGGAAVLALSITWSWLLNSNLDAWREASRQLAAIKKDLGNRLANLSSSSKILIPTLPQDYKGAPILGRPEYLAVLCREPFADRNVTPFVLTLEPVIAGGEEYVSPTLFRRASQEAKTVLSWDQNTSKTLFTRLEETAVESPQVSMNRPSPLSLQDRFQFLHAAPAHPIVTYDAQEIPQASAVKIYVSKAWNPFTNAPRTVPPTESTVEWESDRLPLVGKFALPGSIRGGVHDVAVMAFDAHGKPTGLMSEALPVNVPAAE